MENQQLPPPLLIIFASIIIALLWLLFLGIWLLFYASGFGILQNIGIFFISLVVVAILETVIWISWGMNQMRIRRTPKH